MKNLVAILSLSCLLIFLHCKDESPAGKTPFVSKFNTAGSDPHAIAIADKVISASGGMQAWEDVKCLKWNFFGRRWWLWDKVNQKVRVENVQNDTKMILDLKTMKGLVYKDGKIWNDADTIKKYLEGAYKMWINDVYWLVMPFKIKDEGVHLNYVKEDTTQTGIQADVISMTFDSVGVTPNNKYEVWVGKNSNLIAQWAFYANKTDSVPGFISPWDGYVKYGGVFLSSDRGGKRQLSGIKVLDQIPQEVFNKFDPIDFDHF